MFFNLNAEMGRAKLTIKKLSEITAINYEFNTNIEQLVFVELSSLLKVFTS